ncbi:hypothetical protein RRG08_002778 [Elysia crispata]|uniref:Uncharacterized protein n=1 Tax=Elysia crispata TaxID=231223 RepID=A0AAE1CMP7_9GAST|nr:hypothetical protein RRG08_002778 [Elysia crispata]
MADWISRWRQTWHETEVLSQREGSLSETYNMAECNVLSRKLQKIKIIVMTNFTINFPKGYKNCKLPKNFSPIPCAWVREVFPLARTSLVLGNDRQGTSEDHDCDDREGQKINDFSLGVYVLTRDVLEACSA